MAGLKEFFLGKGPEDVELDPRFAETAERRAGLRSMVEESAAGRGPSIAAETGRRGLADLIAGQRSAAASARGLGSIGAQRAAQANIARGTQAIAGQTALQRLQEQEQARRGLAALLSEEEQALLREQQLRQAGATEGFLPALLAGGGAAIGGKFGGVEGAQAGAEIGSSTGRAFSQGLR